MEITILLFNPECPVDLDVLIKKHFPPLKFLKNQHCFGIFLKTRRKDCLRRVSFKEMYRLSEQINGTYVHFRYKNKETDRTIYRKVGPVDKSFKEFFYQPLSEYKAFSNAVIQIIDSIKISLKAPGNELEKLFEEFKDIRARQTVSAKLQDFKEAATYRDKGKDIVVKIQDYLKKSVPGNDLDKALDYILKNYHELF